MPIIETTKNHFLEQFEQHIDDVLTWDEEISHSAEPTLFAAARHLCLAKGGKRARPKVGLFLCKGIGFISIGSIGHCCHSRVHTQCKFAP